METRTEKIKTNMKKAVVDQILLWTVIFVSFVTILFLVIDYSMIMRVKGNADLMSQYSARMIAIGKTNDEIATQLNSMKLDYFATVAGTDISCTSSALGSYKVIFTVNGLYTDTHILNNRSTISSRSAVFNELSTDEIECTLTLNKQ